MADSLADLFVSFKAVERPKKSSKSSIWKSSSRSGRYSGWGDDDIFASLYDDDIYSRVVNNPYYDYPFYRSPSVTENTGEEEEESYMGTSYNYGSLGRYTQSESTLSAITEPRERAEKLKSDIKDLFKKAGIDDNEYIITSDLRSPGAAGNAGNRSWHTKGYALDVTVVNGRYEDFVKKLVNDNDIRSYFITEGLGILDEWKSGTQQQTGATGPHIHIGPDRAAREWLTKFMQDNGINRARYGGKVFRARRGVKLTKEENAINHWSNRMFDSFRKAIKEKYGKRCPGERADKLALYMTAQAAITSNYGDAKNNNYGNLRKENGDTASFDSMIEYAKAQVNTLDSWNIVSAETLREYVDKLFSNEDGMVYDASEYPEVMYRKMEASAKEINNAIGLSMKIGGSLERIRQLYADTAKFFKGGSVGKYAKSGEIEDSSKDDGEKVLEKDPDDPTTEERIIDKPLSELIAYYTENSTDALPKNKNDNEGKENWTRLYFANLLSAYRYCRDEFDLKLSDKDIKNLAFWGLLQGAIESGWGVDKDAQECNNYAGMQDSHNKNLQYNNMFDGCLHRFKNLWSIYPNAIEANDFWGYIEALFNTGIEKSKRLIYCTGYVNNENAKEENGWDMYGDSIQGCYRRAINYLGLKEGDFEKPKTYSGMKEESGEKIVRLSRRRVRDDDVYDMEYKAQLQDVLITEPKYDPNFNIDAALGYKRDGRKVIFEHLENSNY